MWNSGKMAVSSHACSEQATTDAAGTIRFFALAGDIVAHGATGTSNDIAARNLVNYIVCACLTSSAGKIGAWMNCKN